MSSGEEAPRPPRSLERGQGQLSKGALGHHTGRAGDRPYEEHLVEHAGVRLGIIGVDMNGGPRDLDASARRAALCFVREAVARRSRPTMAV